jgi:hypothetical protein
MERVKYEAWTTTVAPLDSYLPTWYLKTVTRKALSWRLRDKYRLNLQAIACRHNIEVQAISGDYGSKNKRQTDST